MRFLETPIHGTFSDWMVSESAYSFKGYWVDLRTNKVHDCAGGTHGEFAINNDLPGVDQKWKDKYAESTKNGDHVMVTVACNNAEEDVIAHGQFGRADINGYEINIEANSLDGVKHVFKALEDEKKIALSQYSKLVYDVRRTGGGGSHGSLAGPAQILSFLEGKQAGKSALAQFRGE